MIGYGQIIYNPKTVVYDTESMKSKPSHYIGQVKDGMRHGYGIIYFTDPNLELPLEGTFDNDEF